MQTPLPSSMPPQQQQESQSPKFTLDDEEEEEEAGGPPPCQPSAAGESAAASPAALAGEPAATPATPVSKDGGAAATPLDAVPQASPAAPLSEAEEAAQAVKRLVEVCALQCLQGVVHRPMQCARAHGCRGTGTLMDPTWSISCCSDCPQAAFRPHLSASSASAPVRPQDPAKLHEAELIQVHLATGGIQSIASHLLEKLRPRLSRKCFATSFEFSDCF